MNIRPNRKEVTDYRWIANLTDYHKLNPKQLDVAIHGVPFEGKRYPLSYVFWGNPIRFRRVKITLTGEMGTLIGQNIIELPRSTITRGIVKVGGDNRITDLSYSVIKYM